MDEADEADDADDADDAAEAGNASDAGDPTAAERFMRPLPRRGKWCPRGAGHGEPRQQDRNLSHLL